MWICLFLTPTTQPKAIRLRIWRALKALGCPSLRDGVYLLPESRAALFDPLISEVRSHGGQAHVLQLSTHDEAMRTEVLALFDRTKSYAEWHVEVEALNALLPGLDARKFQGKRWATRTRPWVDRFACAWLIRRSIDPEASFIWLADSAVATLPPRGTLGFDFDGARFTHIGSRVSFEVLAASFGLDANQRLQRIAPAVRFLDVGGIPVAEAAGLELVLAGLREVHNNDDALAQAAAPVFDALYAAPGISE